MANAKANIYPIQLQGAELNLNKYNAEIKQYSGFNKNNSPFVGGGLSPIFRKDETVEGATSKNTYIAPNGDVYRVQTDGIYKNDKRIVYFGQTRTFYVREKINTEYLNVIKVYSDKFILYQSGNTLYLNNQSVYSIGEYTSGFLNTEQIVQHKTRAFFDTINNVKYFFFCTARANIAGGQTLYVFNATTGELIASRIVSEGGISRTPIVPMKVFKEPGSQTMRFYSESYTSTGDKILSVTYNFDGTNITSSSSLYTVDNFVFSIQDSASYPNATVFSLKYVDYVIDDFPVNKAYAKKLYDINDSGKTIYHEFDLFLDPNNSRYIYFAHGNSIGYSPCINSSLYNQVIEQKLEQSEYLHSYVLQYESSNNKVYYKCIDCSDVIGFKDITINNTTVKVAYSPLGSIKNCGNFKLRINNNNLSGITTNKDVLLTTWNVVTPFSIFLVDDDTIIVKEGNDFYVIKSGEPELYKKANQLICNVNYSENAIDLRYDKILFFANGYNMSFYHSIYNDYTYFDKNTSENNKYVAAAVNEYDLQKNTSIILNPVNVFLNTSLTLFAHILSMKNFVDFYIGDDSTIYYNKTFFLTNSGVVSSTVNKDLSGLPYPTDTNGNVQYSPSLFSEIKDIYGNDAFIKSGGNFYPLMKYNNETVMSFYLASGIEGLQEGFIVQGQFYGIINNGLYSLRYSNGVVEGVDFVVSVEGLKFCGNTPYQAFFFSKTNRCLYIFNGANVLQQSQFIDIYADIKFYKYNPATHSIFMVTDDCVLVFSSFGTFRLDVPDVEEIYLLENGVVFLNNVSTFMRIKYYNTEDGYTKQNVILETCFYGMNNQTVTINDCLYMRLFSEEHESGDIEVSAVTLSNEGKKTECTTFKIKPSDWDKETNTIYLRYQPKEQRGLGISFKINSPFKICSLSVGSIADAILIDKVSKGAINAPYNNKSSIEEW